MSMGAVWTLLTLANRAGLQTSRQTLQIVYRLRLHCHLHTALPRAGSSIPSHPITTTSALIRLPVKDVTTAARAREPQFQKPEGNFKICQLGELTEITDQQRANNYNFFKIVAGNNDQKRTVPSSVSVRM